MSDELIISQEDMAALLGRPLDDVEKANYDLYLQLAILRLDDLLCIKLEKMAETPVDLQLLLARCFGATTQEQKATANLGISSQKVEDFSLSFQADAKSPMGLFVEQNGALLDKYSMCQGPVRSGKVCCAHCL